MDGVVNPLDGRPLPSGGITAAGALVADKDATEGVAANANDEGVAVTETAEAGRAEIALEENVDSADGTGGPEVVAESNGQGDAEVPADDGFPPEVHHSSPSRVRV